MVSIKDIAADLGVTAATVSNALNGKGRVSEGLAARIRARAEALGYRPSSAAIALKSGRSNILGLVMPDLTNPLFPHIAQSLSTAAEGRDFAILIADSRGRTEEQQQAMRRLISRGVDGLIVVPQRGASPPPQRVPMAIINAASDPNNTVSSDHVGGGAAIASHIVDLGHEKVVILGGDPVSEVQQDRMTGMKSVLEGSVETLIRWGEDEIAQAPDWVAQGVTAILTTSDLLALKVRSALFQRGIKVPMDVSLTGFDDMAFGQVMFPPLTTVRQNTLALGNKVVAILAKQIEERSEDRALTTPPSSAQPEGEDTSPGQTIPMQLVVRKSTASPKQPSTKEILK